MGITKGKWSTLTTEFLAFKGLYDANAPLGKALPSLTESYPQAYADMGLRDLCSELHEFNTNHKVAQVMREMYSVLPAQVMIPADAYERLVLGKVERVEIDQLPGRIAATMLVPCPPGIPPSCLANATTKTQPFSNRWILPANRTRNSPALSLISTA